MGVMNGEPVIDRVEGARAAGVDPRTLTKALLNNNIDNYS